MVSDKNSFISSFNNFFLSFRSPLLVLSFSLKNVIDLFCLNFSTVLAILEHPKQDTAFQDYFLWEY